jgi:small-conductance mechanosensitive channel
MKLFNYDHWTAIGLSVLAVLVSTLIVWWFLARAAGQVRRRFNALLSVAQDAPDPQHAVDAVQRRLTALRLVVNAAKYVLFAGALLTTLRILRVPLDSLVLPAGFLGAALGLGSQNLVRDVVAGLFIVFEGQFAVGDVVSINGTLGRVDEIGLRVTRLRDEAGQLHFFPNGAINTVARYPDHSTALIVIVPLADASQSTTAVTVVCAALEHFGADYGALTNGGEIEVLEMDSGNENGEDSAAENAAGASTPPRTASTPRTLRFQLPVRPTKASVTREKLPARIVAALEDGGIKIMVGAEVVIFNAPAAGDPLLGL